MKNKNKNINKRTNINRDKYISQVLECRSYTDDSGNTFIEGYAAKYDTRSKPIFERGKLFYEILKRGAFDNALLKEDVDVILTYNHNLDMPLARFNPSRNSNTLELSADEIGLRFKASLGDTTLSKDLQIMLSRNDVNACSFVFTVEEAGEKWERSSSGDNIRYISSITDLYDVSVVVNPAYDDTEVALKMRNYSDDNDDDSNDTDINNEVDTNKDDVVDDNIDVKSALEEIRQFEKELESKLKKFELQMKLIKHQNKIK